MDWGRRSICMGLLGTSLAPLGSISCGQTNSAASITPGDAQALDGAELNPGKGFWSAPRWVWLKRASTGEQVRIAYWKDGVVDQNAYGRISWFMRDLRFEQMMQQNHSLIRSSLGSGRITNAQVTPWMLLDPVLLDILYAYSAWLAYHGVNHPLIVNSGFRHPLTNAMTEGAARHSWHTRGGAADLVVPGISPTKLASFGAWLQGGGVGLYPNRNFIHVDRGNVRRWVG